MVKRWCIPLAGLALVLGALATAGPAAAAGTPRHAVHVIRPGAPIWRVSGPHGISHQSTSNNWSGYDVTSGGYTKVSANWVEPSASCPSGSQWSSFWVGLDGDGSNTVEQTGSEADCTGAGSPSYYAWWEMYPGGSHSFSNTVRPGDHFSASVTNTSGSSYKLVISDSTEGWSHTLTKSLGSASDASAEAIVEAPCCTGSGGILPLADFHTVSFSSVMVDGQAIGNLGPQSITMVDGSGRDKDTVSALSGGTSFSATWVRKN